jgi:hypothetical protein
VAKYCEAGGLQLVADFSVAVFPVADVAEVLVALVAVASQGAAPPRTRASEDGIRGRFGNVTVLPPQTPALYRDALEVKLSGAPKSFRLRISIATTGPLPVGTFSSQDLCGVGPDLTSESYPVAQEVSSEGDARARERSRR